MSFVANNSTGIAERNLSIFINPDLITNYNGVVTSFAADVPESLPECVYEACPVIGRRRNEGVLAKQRLAAVFNAEETGTNIARCREWRLSNQTESECQQFCNVRLS